jgi:hypothetical protein
MTKASKKAPRWWAGDPVACPETLRTRMGGRTFQKGEEKAFFCETKPGGDRAEERQRKLSASAGNAPM